MPKNELEAMAQGKEVSVETLISLLEDQQWFEDQFRDECGSPEGEENA